MSRSALTQSRAAVAASFLWAFAVLAWYEDPVLAAQRIEFGSGLSDLLTTLLAGLIARSAR